jgi:hypothetical protein
MVSFAKELVHLGLGHVAQKPFMRTNAPPFILSLYPIPPVDDYLIDPDYPVETYL